MRRLSIGAVVSLAAAAAGPAASASTTSGLAIDTWLHNAMNSFVGPVAYAAVLVGIVVAGARLMSGADLYGFLRALVMLTIIAGLTAGGQTIIGMMSANAAVVAPPRPPSANAATFPQFERSTS